MPRGAQNIIAQSALTRGLSGKQTHLPPHLLQQIAETGNVGETSPTLILDLLRMQLERVATNQEYTRTPTTNGHSAQLQSVLGATNRAITYLLRAARADKETRKAIVTLNQGPHVVTQEIPANFLELPESYEVLKQIPLIQDFEVRGGISFKTPANKRTDSPFEINHCPVDFKELVPKDWTGAPLNIGGANVLVYMHRSEGCQEMEAGLLKLFPLATKEELRSSPPKDIFVFGDPNGKFMDRSEEGYKDEHSDFGMFEGQNGITVTSVPFHKALMYFGYLKKGLLTVTNIRALKEGKFPLHCAANRYVVDFDDDENPEISDVVVKADDMGSVRAQTNGQLTFQGTEIGAFACLDGFGDETEAAMEQQSVGFNKGATTNSRVVITIGTKAATLAPEPVDILLYADNGHAMEQDQKAAQVVNPDHPEFEHQFNEIANAFKEGKRVAAGTTTAKRGQWTEGWWGMSFVGERNDALKFQRETEVIEALRALAKKGEVAFGIGHTQLMAGLGNTPEELAKKGHITQELAERAAQEDKTPLQLIQEMNTEEREQYQLAIGKQLEMRGPEQFARANIVLIHDMARRKRQRTLEETGKMPRQVSILEVQVGDSRTGKSESLVAMLNVLERPDFLHRMMLRGTANLDDTKLEIA